MKEINIAYLPYPKSQSKYLGKYFTSKKKSRNNKRNIIRITGYRYNKHSKMAVSCYICEILNVAFYDDYGIVDEDAEEYRIGLICLKELKELFYEEKDKDKLMMELL